MTQLSTAAWAIHDVGLATAIGGTLFGRTALQPALNEIENPHERGLVSARAWRRFSWLNLAGHLAFAVPWLVGRKMLTGCEVSHEARMMTSVKDALVVTSLVTGVGSILFGRKLGARARRDDVRERGHQKPARGLQRLVGALGIMNLMTNMAIAAVTKGLAMESSQSVRFAARSRRLP